MAVEMIDSIRASEAAAAEIRKSALAKAKEIVAHAEERAKSYAAESEKKAYDESNRILGEAHRKTEDLLEEQTASFTERSACVKEKAQANVDKAADFILKELLKV